MRTMLKSKIHRATITDTNLHYEGSIGIDAHLLELADLLPCEQVHVLDVDNGGRFETYVIEEPAGSGRVAVYGAAARLVEKGDVVIILSYQVLPDDEARTTQPRVVSVDERNAVRSPSAEGNGLGTPPRTPSAVT